LENHIVACSYNGVSHPVYIGIAHKTYGVIDGGGEPETEMERLNPTGDEGKRLYKMYNIRYYDVTSTVFSIPMYLRYIAIQSILWERKGVYIYKKRDLL